MDIHVLNGDSLADKFPLAGEVIVCREVLMDGPVQATSLSNFWKVRASYISGAYQENEEFYLRRVKNEFEKLKKLENVSAINLWFKHDLFCQVNMWFVLHYLAVNEIHFPIYRVMPSSEGESIWAGFGPIEKEALNQCYDLKIQFSENDINLGANLWKAYQGGDLNTFKNLSLFQSQTFPYLTEVCEAHIQRLPEKDFARPQSRLKQLTSSGVTNFDEIFNEFGKTEGIYGYGDRQVKNMLASL